MLSVRERVPTRKLLLEILIRARRLRRGLSPSAPSLDGGLMIVQREGMRIMHTRNQKHLRRVRTVCDGLRDPKSACLVSFVTGV